MKLRIIGLIFVLVISGSFSTDLFGGEKGAITKVIEQSYFNGAFNSLDTMSMRKGFHPEFAIFYPKGDKIGRYPIDAWIKGIEKRKSDPAFDKSKAKMECKIVTLDFTAGSAAAKVEIGRDGKIVYTDYLSLLKFKDGWKIVAKIYHEHK